MKARDLGLLAMLIAIDQLSKIILKNKSLGIINYQVNYGAAFSILQGYRWLFIAVAVIVIIAIAFYYKKAESKLPLLLILAGTAGNLIDRVFLGYVRDFIDLKVWPIFNLADSYNVIGAVLLLYLVFKKKA